jgi:hypothetical protein
MELEMAVKLNPEYSQRSANASLFAFPASASRGMNDINPRYQHVYDTPPPPPRTASAMSVTDEASLEKRLDMAHDESFSESARTHSARRRFSSHTPRQIPMTTTRLMYRQSRRR